MDLLAAISTVDPPSLVAWLVLAFAIALYPLGLMMGTGCSGCCSCGELPYHRCRRTECLTCTPRNGFSASTARIDGTTGAIGVGTGATLICARSRIFLSVRGSSFTHLAAGNSEQHSATLTRAYNDPTMFLVDGPGPAIPGAFTVIAQGMDLPFNATKTDTQTFYLSQDVGETQTKTVAFGQSGTARKSVAAALSAHVRAVRVTVGGDYLDGTLATESAMLAMLSITSPQHNSGERFSFDLTLTANAALFPYLRRFYSVDLEYTIELRRGSASVYRTVTAVIANWTYEELPLPEKGLPALNLPARTFADTPYPCQKQPVIDGTTITVFAGSEVNAQTPEYFSEPYGAGHFFPLFFYSATEALSRSIICETSRYVFDPTGASSSFNPLAGPYNLNYDEVDEFIRGERCLQWSSGGNTYERCMEPANMLCGLAVCDRPWLLPQTATFSIPTPCAGTDLTVVGRIYTHSVPDTFNSNSSNNCRYYAAVGACGEPDNQLRYAFPAASFFDGDLLYSLENGPSRNTLALPATTGWSNPRTFGSTYYSAPGGTVTLGGTADPQGISFSLRCPDGFPAHYSGKCLPDTASVSVSGVSIGAVEVTSGQVLSAEDFDTLKQLADDVAGGMSGGTVNRTSGGLACTSAIYNNDTSSGGAIGATSLVAGASLDGECGVLSTGYLVRRNKGTSVGPRSFTVAVELGPSSKYAVGTSAVGGNGSFVRWSVNGTVSVSASTTTATKQFSSVTTSPTTIDWRGGSFSFTSSGTGGPNPNGTSSILPRLDGIQAIKPASVLVNGFLPAITEIAQDYRPCGVVSLGVPSWNSSETGFNSSASNRTESGIFELGFIDSTPCSTPVSVTTTSDWLTIEMDAEGRSFCVRVASNETGEQRQATIRISPAWVVPSNSLHFPTNAPSTSTAAVLGTLQYALTQNG